MSFIDTLVKFFRAEIFLDGEIIGKIVKSVVPIQGEYGTGEFSSLLGDETRLQLIATVLRRKLGQSVPLRDILEQVEDFDVWYVNSEDGIQTEVQFIEFLVELAESQDKK